MNNSVAIVFATWHGQAEKVARRIADVAYMNGVPARAENVESLQPAFAL